ncbi:hypothetical protein POM88_003113 [Heracleum sosnowskyi]|uniref:Uncharacterized protein n=1 Tax=Heracleum sosnowskyi TaxID=360622 RepID=A0AAD8JGW0_9APIA|nr:hypothetical protein POM88_003113 [Heracleum sosnowskyi]
MSMIELLRAAVAQDKKYVALDDGKGSYGVVFSVIDTIPTLCDNLRIIKLALALGMEQQKRYAFMYSLRCFQGFALSTFLNVHFVEHWMKCSGKYQSNNPMIKPLRLRLRRQLCWPYFLCFFDRLGNSYVNSDAMISFRGYDFALPLLMLFHVSSSHALYSPHLYMLEKIS